MTALISKLQYKNYEKGEFSDEQARSLDETLELLKNFPWDVQRGADIQLSGPGIVIKGTDGSYLKVALYFNGKFSVYYMDAGDRLYEYHTPELNEECQKVKEYFEGNLNLDGFEKHFFNVGNRAHFVNGDFKYQVSDTKAPLLIVFLAIFAVIFILAIVFLVATKDSPLLVLPLLLFNTLLFTWGLYAYTKLYNKSKNQVLVISKGNPVFQFGTKGNMVSYHKSDIAEITRYGGSSGKSTELLIIDICFKNGDHIKFPGILIDSITFIYKIPEGIKLNTVTNFGALMRNIWNY